MAVGFHFVVSSPPIRYALWITPVIPWFQGKSKFGQMDPKIGDIRVGRPNFYLAEASSIIVLG